MNIKVKEELLATANRNNLGEIAERIKSITPDEIRVKVAFLGEFNSGKTTIINALIHKKILPVFALPTTAVITEIGKGDEDEAFVMTIEGGAVVQKSIRFSELAEEITKTDYNKKIVINLQNLDFLPKNTLLIDTPGVASINDTHDDITYGYLPIIDAAFVVINPDSGDMPKTLLNFIRQFPEDLIEKIYFVISRSDQVPEKDMESIKEQISISLRQIIQSPKVFVMSGKNAYDAIEREGNIAQEQYQKSGILELLKIISEDIPAYKNEIEEKRIKEQLDKEKSALLELLEIKFNALSWDTEEFSLQIRNYKDEIELLRTQSENFKDKFNSLKRTVIAEIIKIVEEYAGVIGHKIIKDEPYENLIKSMIDEVKSAIEISLIELKSIKFDTENQTNNIDIADILQALIEKETSAIKNISELITDAATFALTVWVVPGSTALINTGEAVVGTGVILAQGTDNNPKKDNNNLLETVSKITGAIGKVIKNVNPIEKIKIAVMPYFINPRLTVALTSKMTSTINNVYDILSDALNNEIDVKYMQPLVDKELLLKQTQNSMKEYLDKIELVADSLQTDITLLKTTA